MRTGFNSTAIIRTASSHNTATMMNSFLHAIQLLTRLPLGKKRQSGLSGDAVCWYAPVGMIIGVIIAVIASLSHWLALPPAVSALAVLIVWVGITGALHLDGLADCGDAWMGGHTPERMLEIMKDTACGVGALVVVVLVLLAKFIALSLLLQQGHWMWLVFAPVIARIVLSLIICATPYIRSDGIGASLQSSLPHQAIGISALLLSVVLCLISLPAFVIATLASILAFSLIYYCFIKPLHGATGDIYGALVETTETAVLLGLVVAS